jgi:hypothetical protein
MSILNILVGKIDYIQIVFMYSNSSYCITLLYAFTCLYNYTDIVPYTAYFVFVLTFLHPGKYWIYGNKDDDDDDDNDDPVENLKQFSISSHFNNISHPLIFLPSGPYSCLKINSLIFIIYMLYVLYILYRRKYRMKNKEQIYSLYPWS